MNKTKVLRGATKKETQKLIDFIEHQHLWLKEGELRVFYRYPERIDERLDRALEGILKTLGYEWQASGFNLINKVRDLAFSKKSGQIESVIMSTSGGEDVPE